MNSITKNKILIGLIILLLAANAATLGSYWLNRSKEKGHALPPPPGEGGPSRYLIKQLTFSKDQQDKYRELIRQHQQGSAELRQKIRESKEKMFAMISQANVPDSVLLDAAKDAGKAMEELDLLTFRHFQEVRKLCNPDQAQEFDRIIQDVLAMMSGRGGPGGPGKPVGPGGLDGPEDGRGPMHDGPPENK